MYSRWLRNALHFNGECFCRMVSVARLSNRSHTYTNVGLCCAFATRVGRDSNTCRYNHFLFTYLHFYSHTHTLRLTRPYNTSQQSVYTCRFGLLSSTIIPPPPFQFDISIMFAMFAMCVFEHFDRVPLFEHRLAHPAGHVF